MRKMREGRKEEDGERRRWELGSAVRKIDDHPAPITDPNSSISSNSSSIYRYQPTAATAATLRAMQKHPLSLTRTQRLYRHIMYIVCYQGSREERAQSVYERWLCASVAFSARLCAVANFTEPVRGSCRLEMWFV